MSAPHRHEPSSAPTAPDDVRDVLPDDLDAAGFVGAYRFPDNSRRRIPGVIYLVLAALCLALYLVLGDESVVVNDGFAWAALLLAVVGAISVTSGWRMTVDEKDALVAAQRAVGFPVGHASAQQVWHGLRSRPTWRVLCYSTDRVSDPLELLREGVNDPHPRVRFEAVRALSFFDNEKAVEVATESLVHEQDDYLKYVLQETMNTLDRRVKAKK